MQLHLFGLALLPIAALAHGTQMYHGHPLYHSPARLFFDVAEMRGNSTIVRRGEHIDDNKWDASVCRGRTLMALMEADDREAGQMMSPKKDSAGSIYVSCWEDEVKKWGWTSEDYNRYDLKDLGIYNALKGLGVKAEKGDTHARLWVHNKDVNNGGKTYKATDGTFLSIVEPDSGALISVSRFSPTYMGRGKGITGDGVTEISRFSDVVYLQLTQFERKDKKSFDLRYVMMAQVQNEIVMALISRALVTTANSLVEWEGVTFTHDTTEFLAILGSPYGTAVSTLLFQHKKQLGKKVVDKITVFKDTQSGTRPPSLVFHIKGDSGQIPTQCSSKSCTKAPLNIDDDQGDNEGPAPSDPNESESASRGPSRTATVPEVKPTETWYARKCDNDCGCCLDFYFRCKKWKHDECYNEPSSDKCIEACMYSMCWEDPKSPSVCRYHGECGAQMDMCPQERKKGNKRSSTTEWRKIDTEMERRRRALPFPVGY